MTSFSQGLSPTAFWSPVAISLPGLAWIVVPPLVCSTSRSGRSQCKGDWNIATQLFKQGNIPKQNLRDLTKNQPRQSFAGVNRRSVLFRLSESVKFFMGLRAQAWLEHGSGEEKDRVACSISRPWLGCADQDQTDGYSEEWEQLLLVKELVDLRPHLGPFYIHKWRDHFC